MTGWPSAVRSTAAEPLTGGVTRTGSHFDRAGKPIGHACDRLPVELLKLGVEEQSPVRSRPATPPAPIEAALQGRGASTDPVAQHQVPVGQGTLHRARCPGRTSLLTVSASKRIPGASIEFPSPRRRPRSSVRRNAAPEGTPSRRARVPQDQRTDTAATGRLVAANSPPIRIPTSPIAPTPVPAR